MRGLILSALLLVTSGFTCSKRVPRATSDKMFIFQQKVSITGGFYKGQTGTVVDQVSSYIDCRMIYEVKLDALDKLARVCNSDMVEGL